MATMNRNILSYLFFIVLVSCIDASNFNKPHTHTGKVEPFQPGDPKVKLDGKALSILKTGKPYQVGILQCLLI
jgi:hypothetical protein